MMAAYWGDDLGNLSRGECVTILMWAQGKVCPLCGQSVSKHQATIDHVVPRSSGGAHHFTNWLLAHKLCNEKKANKKATSAELELLAKAANRLPSRFKTDTKPK